MDSASIGGLTSSAQGGITCLKCRFCWRMLQDKVRTVKNRTFEKRKHMVSVIFHWFSVILFSIQNHPFIFLFPLLTIDEYTTTNTVSLKITTIENRYCVQMVNAVRSSFCFIRVASPLKSVRHGVALHPLKRYMRRWNSRRKRCFFKSKIHIYLAYTIMWMIHNGAISLLL